MLIRRLPLPLLCLALVAAGCTPTATPVVPAPSTSTSNAQRLDEIKQDTKAVDQDLQDYTYVQKAEFTARMQAQLDDIGKDLEQLSVKIEAGPEGAKVESRKKIQELREDLAKQHAQLDKVKGADASTWNDIKNSTRKGYSDLKDGVKSARQWLSDKIAP